MTTLQDLIAQREALARQQEEITRSIAEFQSAQRSQVIQDIKALMAQHGLSVNDLVTTGKRAAAAPAATKETSKVAIKYRDPDSGSTWTGRGLKPRWLVAALEGGRTLEEFLVEPAASAA
ncbi:MAG: hypothetical protein RL456_2908 [Pseudomonadota bacterium]|jgi:DNA-binding protein H-NS